MYTHTLNLCLFINSYIFTYRVIMKQLWRFLMSRSVHCWALANNIIFANKEVALYCGGFQYNVFSMCHGSK